jgi:hypothetical protein
VALIGAGLLWLARHQRQAALLVRPA